MKLRYWKLTRLKLTRKRRQNFIIKEINATKTQLVKGEDIDITSDSDNDEDELEILETFALPFVKDENKG